MGNLGSEGIYDSNHFETKNLQKNFGPNDATSVECTSYINPISINIGHW